MVHPFVVYQLVIPWDTHLSELIIRVGLLNLGIGVHDHAALHRNRLHSITVVVQWFPRKYQQIDDLTQLLWPNDQSLMGSLDSLSTKTVE